MALSRRVIERRRAEMKAQAVMIAQQVGRLFGGPDSG